MARLLVVVGLVAVAKALDGIVLVQLKTESYASLRKHRIDDESKGAHLDIAQLYPMMTFEATKAKIEALGRQLAEVGQHDMQRLAKQQEAYMGQLRDKQLENLEIEHVNAKIASRIRKVNLSNIALRRRSHDMAKANDKLRSDLHTMQSNITLAQEFVQDGLGAVETSAPEVQVLAELAELDAAASKTLEKQARLKEMFGEPLGDLSFLEFSGGAHERAHVRGQSDESLEAAVQLLAAQVKQLSKDQTSSEASLQEAFEKKLLIEAREHEALLEEQTWLNKSSVETIALHERLAAALKYLSKVHERLSARLKATGTFFQRLAASNLGAQEVDDAPLHVDSAGSAEPVFVQRNHPHSELPGKAPKRSGRAQQHKRKETNGTALPPLTVERGQQHESMRQAGTRHGDVGPVVAEEIIEKVTRWIHSLAVLLPKWLQ